MSTASCPCPCPWLTLPAGLSTRPLTAAGDTVLLEGTKRGRFLEAAWHPLEIPGASRWLALAHVHLFVTGPTWGTRLADVPERTLMLLAATAEGCVAIVPILDGDTYCELAAAGDGLALTATSGPRGLARDHRAVAVAARNPDPYAAVEQAVDAAIEFMRRGKRRADKPLPPWMDEIGWCTYDAFYDKVDEARTLDALGRFNAAGFHPRFLILDGGWQDTPDNPRWIESFGPKPDAFTGDRLATLVAKTKDDFGVHHFAAWHTLFGSMRGTNIEAPALAHLPGRFVHELETDDDVFGVVDLESVGRLHDGYHAALAAEGVDFVKVDFQSALHRMTYEEAGRAEAARRWQESLQEAARRHLPGGVLNCMCMGSEMVYHTHTSNVSRCSDDFYPQRPHAHPAHVRQNLYNALWLERMVWCDWDMFWSAEPQWGWYHAVARALSGGPVYVSDRPDHFDPALLARFLAADDRLLRYDRPARPTPDMIFRDPFAAPAFIKGFNVAGETGAVGLFHPGHQPAEPPLTEHVGPALVPQLGGERFAAHAADRGWLGVVDADRGLPITLEPAGADLLTFAPIIEGCAVLGLIDKLAPAPAIQHLGRTPESLSITLRGGGRFAVYHERAIERATLDGEPVTPEPTGAEAPALSHFETGNRRTAELHLAWA